MKHTAYVGGAFYGLSRRGMALLLVMIGMVVCTVLTTGFLSTQGTSIGIARNERDAAKAHAMAQSGIDMCYWLIRNKPDWRTTMPSGSWLSNLPVGDGAVSAWADDDNHHFADDASQPVTVTATGSYASRTFTLSATIRPTGGGTVFQNGNLISGNISLGNSDLITAAVLDSYNSNIASYNPLFPGSNATLASSTTANGGLKCYSPSIYRGSYIAAPSAVLSSIIQTYGSSTGPASVSFGGEVRNPGSVVFPNTAGLLPCGSASNGNFSSAKQLNQAGIYDDFSVTNGASVYINAPGTYVINNNIGVGPSINGSVYVKDGTVAHVIVNGDLNVTSNCKMALLGNDSRLYLYVNGNVTINNGTINNAGNTSHVVVFGGSNGGTIKIQNTSGVFCGAIYAPQHDVTLQTNYPKLYGAVLAKSLALKNGAAFHFDEALRSFKIDQITDGSAPTGTPNYSISINSGPTIPR
jgi:Tfp pilus assembly protein PilX